MKNTFFFIVAIFLGGFLVRSIYKGNTKLSLAIFLGLLLAAAVWVIIYLLKHRAKNAELEFLNEYRDAVTEAAMDRLGKEIEDKDSEIASLKAELEASLNDYADLLSKVRDYRAIERSLKRTPLGIEAQIYLKVIERLKGMERWEGFKADLFDEESEKRKNAYEQILPLYRDGSQEYPIWGWLKLELTDMLLHEFCELDTKQQKILRDFVREQNLIEIERLFPDAGFYEREHCLQGDELEVFLLHGFEEFMPRYAGIIVNKMPVRIIFNDWDERRE